MQEFRIHEAVLTARSKFFKAAMGKQWKESEDKAVKLPEENPDVFRLYTQLVYTGRIPRMNDDTPQTDETVESSSKFCNTEDECEEEYKLLCGLYVLTEKMMDLRARNQTVDALYYKMKVELAKAEKPMLRCLPTSEVINIMYDGTAMHCVGRQILVSCYTWHTNELADQYAEHS
jgi:hypothetical protein